MKKLISLTMMILSSASMSDVACVGKVAEVTKWSSQWNRNMSYSLELKNGDRTPFVQVDDDETRSMILTAYAAQKEITVKWVSTDNITSCVGGAGSWNHYDKVVGYITLR